MDGLVPTQKLSEPNFGERGDGVDISRTAIVFGEISAQGFVHIGRSQHQQEPLSLGYFELGLCQHVR